METFARYGLQQTIYFPLIDAGTTDFENTPVTFAAGDTQVSVDGGAFANTTNNPAHEGNGIYSLVLTAAELSGTRIVVTIVDSATKAWEDQCVIVNTLFSGQIEANLGIPIFEVETGTTAASNTAFSAVQIAPTTTEEATADHFNDRTILWTTGALAGQMTSVSDYQLLSSESNFTVPQMTDTPADGDRFVVL